MPTRIANRSQRFWPMLALAATLQVPLCTVHAAEPASAAGSLPVDDLAQRRALCGRSITLSGLEQDMDSNIREEIEQSFRTLSAAYPDDAKTVGAYRDSLAEAMTAAKHPVLAKLQESCAAAFTADELNGINAFYESRAGRAWLEKGRALMIPALEKAVSDVTPQVIVDAERRFCARIGGCTKPPPASRTDSL